MIGDKKPADTTFPQDDPRMKLLLARMKKENFRPDALIEILHTAQNAYGHLPLKILRFIAKMLHLPPSRVYSTVTFYHFFSLRSKGEHTCLVCTGTACYVKGAQQLLNAVEDKHGLKPGQVSPGNELGVEVARCIGACGMAPVVVYDDEVLPTITPEKLLEKITTTTGLS